jgi:Pectate lyase superfamily protein
MTINLALASLKATGSTTTRAFGTRFIEVKNVKDFDATGDGVTNDQPAIQAAVDYITSPYTQQKRGVIFFPPGIYQVNSPITYESLTDDIQNVHFMGAPGAKIRGNFADYILKRSANSPVAGTYCVSHLEIENSNAAGGCINFNSIIGGKIFDCRLSAFIGVRCENSQCVTIDSSSIINAGLSGDSIGIIAGNATTLIAVDVSAYKYGLIHQNAGLTVIGGRFEVNTFGFAFGLTEALATASSSSVFITGVSMESNGTSLYLPSGSGLSTATFTAIGITCSKQGKQAGIDFNSVGDHVTFSDITVSNTETESAGDDGWSVAGIRIIGGNYYTLNNVLNTTTCTATTNGILFMSGTNSNVKVSGCSSVVVNGSAWTVGSGADIEWDRCPNAPVPTLAQLPAASAVAPMARRRISDANTAPASQVYGAAITGTGSNAAWAWTDGTTWRYG